MRHLPHQGTCKSQQRANLINKFFIWSMRIQTSKVLFFCCEKEIKKKKRSKDTEKNGKLLGWKTASRWMIKMGWGGLPWWRSGWDSACQCRGHGFEPWSGKIPHAAGQLGPWATIAEPARLEPVLCNKRGRDSERPAHRGEEWPPLAATRESPRTETKTQHSPK